MLKSPETLLSRREFLKVAGTAVAGLILSSCAGKNGNAKETQEAAIYGTKTLIIGQLEKNAPKVATLYPTITEAVKTATPELSKYEVKADDDLVKIQALFKDKVPAVNGDDYYLWYLYNTEALFDPFNIPAGTQLIIPSSISPQARETEVPPEKWQYGYGEIWTSLKGSTDNRRKNIFRGVELINNKIIKPYAIFSMNETVGPITAENGYVMGFGYLDNREMPITGGGICQLPSTLFKAVLEAGMYVVERHEHMFYAERYLPGFDATISETLDLKVRNISQVPFQIRTTVDKEKDRLGISIWAPNSLPYKFVEVETTINNEHWNDGKIHAEVVQRVGLHNGRVREKKFGSIYTPR